MDAPALGHGLHDGADLLGDPAAAANDLAHILGGNAKLQNQGVALKDIQEWLGHSDIGTTGNIYTHLDYSSKVSSAQAILGILPDAE